MAARDVSFTANRGQCVALVGESGSGTMIARTIAGLHPIAGGQIVLENESLSPEARRRSRSQRQRIQIVFQDPSDALNPRHTVLSAVARPARRLRGLSRQDADAEAGSDRLDLFGYLTGSAIVTRRSLSVNVSVGIARALAAEPDLMVCDEITSALRVGASRCSQPGC